MTPYEREQQATARSVRCYIIAAIAMAISIGVYAFTDAVHVGSMAAGLAVGVLVGMGIMSAEMP